MRKAQMRELLDTALDGAAYIDRALTQGAADASILSLLENLYQAADLLAESTQDTSQFLPQIPLYFRNIGASIDEALHDPAQMRRIFSMEIRPFLIETDRLWDFQADVLSSEEGIARYRQEMMQRVKALRTAPCEQYRYDVSIVVLAYNKLEYTKAAIESIFAHTDFSAGNIELITINNGSDDGTRAFFDRLPHRKKVNLTYNVLGINLSQHIIEGKYYILFPTMLLLRRIGWRISLQPYSRMSVLRWQFPSVTKKERRIFKGFPFHTAIHLKIWKRCRHLRLSTIVGMIAFGRNAVSSCRSFRFCEVTYIVPDCSIRHIHVQTLSMMMNLRYCVVMDGGRFSLRIPLCTTLVA